MRSLSKSMQALAHLRTTPIALLHPAPCTSGMRPARDTPQREGRRLPSSISWSPSTLIGRRVLAYAGGIWCYFPIGEAAIGWLGMPGVEDGALLSVFQKYCQFGSRQASLSGEASPTAKRNSLGGPQMDGSKFAKLAREAGLIDGQRITVTEVDILFNRVKDRSERRISFAQFRAALKLLADKKYAGEAEAEQRVVEAVRKLEGPMITQGSTVPESSPIIDRLMDGPATYISKTPKDDVRAWKDNLRRSPSSPGSRRSSTPTAQSPLGSRKSSLAPAPSTTVPAAVHHEQTPASDDGALQAIASASLATTGQ